MQVITLMNEKGGTGKTTIAGNLAVGLAKHGYQVLALDTDGQGDLSVSFGLQRAPHFYEFVKRPERDVRELVQRVPADVTGEISGSLFCVAGNNESWGLPMVSRTSEIVGNMAARFKLLSKIFDYVIVDTQPSATQLHDALTLISDWVICPTDPELFSTLGGLPSTLQHIAYNSEQAEARGRKGAEVLCILPNKYRAKTILHQKFVEQLKGKYGTLVWEPIPLRTAVTEAQFMGDFLITSPQAQSLDTTQILNDFVARVISVTAEALA